MVTRYDIYVYVSVTRKSSAFCRISRTEGSCSMPKFNGTWRVSRIYKCETIWVVCHGLIASLFPILFLPLHLMCAQSVRFRPRPRWFDDAKFGIFCKLSRTNYLYCNTQYIIMLFCYPQCTGGSSGRYLHYTVVSHASKSKYLALIIIIMLILLSNYVFGCLLMQCACLQVRVVLEKPGKWK